MKPCINLVVVTPLLSAFYNACVMGAAVKATSVEQAVVYSTSTTGLSTLTFRGEVVVGGGGVEERSEVMYWHIGAYIIYYRNITRHSCIV